MKRKMPETQYRASRMCRVLGNPTAYQIVRALGRSSKTPSELASAVGVSIPSVSVTLRTLRNIDVVRYEPRAKRRVYWVKDAAVLRVLDDLEKYVERMREKR
ncbi:MAG: ArsR family transcriptional regulator [candidate division WOR-3 bacterium]|jgi:DNA-binding transcriptional ArsR family regulator